MSTLAALLADIADAIRVQDRTTAPIPAITFADRVSALSALALDDVLTALERAVEAQRTLLPDKGIRGGVNADGVTWRIDEAAVCDKPYLYKLGYLQSVADGDQGQQIYEWIYRRLYLGERAKPYRINRGGTWYPIDITAAYNGATYLRIPLEQFSGITEGNYHDKSQNGNDTLIRYFMRVYLDNPQLCNVVPTWVIWKYADGRAAYFGVPLYTENEVAQMQAKCWETKTLVRDKVLALYGLRPGTPLSAPQKMRVEKVLHDWLVLHNRYDQENEGEVLDQMMYPALSDGENDPVCAAYALANQWLMEDWGLESVAVRGIVYNGISSTSTNTDGSQERVYYGEPHLWNAVNYSDAAGCWNEDPSEWQEIDVTWDDPTGTADLAYIRWNYFNYLYPSALVGNTPGQKNHRGRYNTAYTYPADKSEGAGNAYTGNTPYIWEETP